MTTFNITPTNKDFKKEIQHKIDNKTKPIGSLGTLEIIAQKLCLIQNTLSPKLNKPTMLVFAGDHGIVNNYPVSSCPQEVTPQMVLNFLEGGAGINVFCNQHNFDLSVIDAGVNFDFEPNTKLINAKIAKGTKDYSVEPAMTKEECNKALVISGEIVAAKHANGSNVISFGEMGIGNTSSASLLMSAVTKQSIDSCIGKGAGLTDEGLANKIDILTKVQKFHGVSEDPFENLQNFGGLEIAMMTGAMLKAAELKMVLIIDGFIATSSLLIAQAINPNILDYCLFSHVSNEQGHIKMLNFLNATPILHLNMRLGEGTGAAIAYPIIQSAEIFINQMASFESAGVTSPV
ncbi:nicotinate-nucleotide--dimethylbenzimidazole phosphoribosyltransferase [Lutibacter sp. HS1-25]|uniref:nicotinate-nucleotide--dimethylbenzimidazole phosphoribosyltransferase n=1 Tax=Lutibacter sp. HS1-25 TaxID=2485000 RepID=UPI0010123D00|nr:nicotinate-nucleotide--dimethylbenzimidazole phosphoribosyltransferase [Lutibacter sp. HS1-25]RXP44809.1 nicotinate-nucleotide--dimethylbenzimidazole phosphoribosyltransferase [Lutibacter sp. HS1-25]